MKFTDVEFVTHCVPGLLTKVEDLEHSDFVGGCLGGHDNVPFNHAYAVAFGIRRIVFVILNTLFTCPLFGMNTGVDH